MSDGILNVTDRQERLYIIYAAQEWKQSACVVTFLTIKLYPDPHTAWVTAPRPFVLFTGEIYLNYVIFIWLFLLQGIKTSRWKRFIPEQKH